MFSVSQERNLHGNIQSNKSKNSAIIYNYLTKDNSNVDDTLRQRFINKGHIFYTTGFKDLQQLERIIAYANMFSF